MDSDAPAFPPLLTGLATAEQDLFAATIGAAENGADGGTVIWSPLHTAQSPCWEVGLILAPEHPLPKALTVIMALQMATVDAIGSLAPPELGVTWAWPDILLANNASVGRLRVSAADSRDDDPPEWLAFALSVELAPIAGDPGDTPDRTSLAEEGCFEIGGAGFTEVWARHALLWLTRWIEGGLAAVELNWRERAFGSHSEEQELLLRLGDAEGKFLGVDEEGGLLLRAQDGGVSHTPLSDILRRSMESDPTRLQPK